jgi:acyl-coenzyme A synthetase/AMP-(fatty) acid ligase
MLCIPADDPGLMLGYWHQPEETAAMFRDGWFLTGDFARRDADGYVWFIGRRDDLINSFGYRVSPHEVERVLTEHPAVLDAAAAGEEVGPGKVVVAAWVVPGPGAASTPRRSSPMGARGSRPTRPRASSTWWTSSRGRGTARS